MRSSAQLARTLTHTHTRAHFGVACETSLRFMATHAFCLLLLLLPLLLLLLLLLLCSGLVSSLCHDRW